MVLGSKREGQACGLCCSIFSEINQMTDFHAYLLSRRGCQLYFKCLLADKLREYMMNLLNLIRKKDSQGGYGETPGKRTLESI